MKAIQKLDRSHTLSALRNPEAPHRRSKIGSRTITLIGRSHLPFGNRYAAYAANGWQLSGTYTAQSGEPVTATINGSITYLSGGNLGNLTTDAGVSNAAFTSGPSARVPDFIARRNAFKGPGVHNLDARVSREFPIFSERYHFEVAAEAFNVANHRNILSVNTALVAYTAPGTSSCPPPAPPTSSTARANSSSSAASSSNRFYQRGTVWVPHPRAARVGWSGKDLSRIQPHH